MLTVENTSGVGLLVEKISPNPAMDSQHQTLPVDANSAAIFRSDIIPHEVPVLPRGHRVALSMVFCSPDPCTVTYSGRIWNAIVSLAYYGQV